MTEINHSEIYNYIKNTLSGNGIKLFSLYKLQDTDRICYGMGLESIENTGVTTSDIRKHLKNDKYEFSVPGDFTRASGAFLHLEIDVTIL